MGPRITTDSMTHLDLSSVVLIMQKECESKRESMNTLVAVNTELAAQLGLTQPKEGNGLLFSRLPSRLPEVC